MVYVMSDIHGNERRFRSVMEQIRLRPEDTLYVLGDVIDRYPGGIRILRKLMAMPNAKLLLGNHEYMMLRALETPYDDNVDDGSALEHWYRNGGDVTHAYWKRIRKTTRREILEFLHNLPVSLDIRVNSMEAARMIKTEGKDNDLLDRLKADPAFAKVADKIDSLVDPRKFVGRAPEQTEEFIREHINPILAMYDYELTGTNVDSVNV